MADPVDPEPLQYIESEKTCIIHCSYCQENLSSDVMPIGTEVLDINSDELKCIHALPSSLKSLHINLGRQIASLPELPQNLESLECMVINITQLPALPPNLKRLCIGTASGVKLSSLPSLPSTIEVLEVPLSSAAVIPPLPSSLKILRFYESDITAIPELPPNLEEFSCAFSTQLQTLPSLPSTLKRLCCRGSGITNLPDLPDGLTWLSVQDTSLPLKQNENESPKKYMERLRAYQAAN
jgi:hypothetical protein